MTWAIWDDVIIDLNALMGGRGYLDPIIVDGETWPRLFGYLRAAINQAGINAAAPFTAFVATSTTALAIGTGNKSLVIQAGKGFQPGQYVAMFANGTPTIFMVGVVQSYNAATGALVVAVSGTGNTGTFASWTIVLSGPQGATGPAGSGSTLHMADDGVQITAAPRPQINLQHSIVPVDNPGSSRVDVALAGDMASPGANKLYGTNAGGVRGWQAAPSAATESAIGLIELATAAEVLAGTDPARAVTPAGLATMFATRDTVMDEFATSGTWTKRQKATWVLVLVVGGGAGGNGGGAVVDSITVYGSGAAGGNGGGWAVLLIPAADLPDTVPVQIGSGGIGGNGATTAAASWVGGDVGGLGGETKFGEYATSGTTAGSPTDSGVFFTKIGVGGNATNGQMGKPTYVPAPTPGSDGLAGGNSYRGGGAGGTSGYPGHPSAAAGLPGPGGGASPYGPGGPGGNSGISGTTPTEGQNATGIGGGGGGGGACRVASGTAVGKKGGNGMPGIARIWTLF